MRGLPRDVMQEGCARIYRVVSGNRIEVEPKSGTPTRPGMKERVGYSPDLFDWLAICVEGARRLGFQIKRLGESLTNGDESVNWLDEWQREHEQVLNSKRLIHR